MTTAEKLMQEGKLEGEIKGLLEVLSWTAPEIAKKYESQVKSAKTKEELEEIKKKIKAEIASKK